MARTTVPKLRKAIKSKPPGIRFEQSLWDSGVGLVAGVDEVGRGAWAGPLTVGAAIIPRDRRIYKVRDSKMLTETEREMLFDRVTEWCVAWGVGHASEVECDQLGMSAAQKLAAQRALAELAMPVEHTLIDGNWDFVGGKTTRIIKGDAKCLSIAAASIIAKVTRDRIMRRVARDHPRYHFDENKGYPCPRHRAELAENGPSIAHRHSWVFMDGLPDNGIEIRRRQQQLFDP